MKKPSIKYIYILSIAVGLIFFIFSLISNYLVYLLSTDLTSQVIINFLVSIFFGVLVTLGLSAFNPVFSDAMITLRRMLRLESLSNPLLLKLSSEAPGTYHHSMNVSNLAQKAAKTVGADSLLVRIAAYYHDLGKLDNPLAFIENQSGCEIPTEEDVDSIRRRSREIISHIERGVTIAKENHLPDEIVDIIKEHHGTTRAIYFFEKAKEKGLKIKKTDFRYAGPAPQSKESAILMLADCVEASVRAIPSLTNEKIESIVNTTFEEKIAEKQFDKSNLSDKDLQKIKLSMLNSLLSIYHQRIQYKKEQNEDID